MKGMTVKELIAHLVTLPPDAPVIVSWEGQYNVISPAAFSVNKDELERPLVVINGEGHGQGSERLYGPLTDAYDADL